MATFLDIGLLQYFQVIFPFIFVFVVVFAGLQYLKLFGKEADKGISALIAICVAAITLFYKPALDLINFMAPWFVILFIFILFVLMTYRFMGAPAESVTEVMKSWGPIHWFLLVFVIIILMMSFSKVFGPSIAGLTAEGAPVQNLTNVTAREPQSFGDNVLAVLFHPKVIGLVFILLIASFTIRMMATKGE